MTRGSKAATDTAQAGLRRRAIEDVDALVQSLIDLRGDLQGYQSGIERMRRKLAEGGRLSDTPRLTNVAEARATLSGRLEDMERARSTARRTLWRLQLAEGMTLSEIARFWGFSRQLVSRTLSAAGALPDGKSESN